MKLDVKNLKVSVDGKNIIKGLSLTIKQGEVHVIMGPNGSGKSTLAKTIFGHPRYKVEEGDIIVDGKSVLKMSTDTRSRLGLFMQFQNPVEVEGVGFINFLNTAKRATDGGGTSVKELMSELKGGIKGLHMNEEFLGRSLNHGFSGGEKKKAEVLQMAILRPKIAILDEPDSGLDIDAVRVVAENINNIAERDKTGLLIITHYSRILSYIKPDFVHIMADGRVVAEGGNELIEKLEREGYDQYIGDAHAGD